jgi:hypothetical protein
MKCARRRDTRLVCERHPNRRGAAPIVAGAAAPACRARHITAALMSDLIDVLLRLAKREEITACDID